MSAEEVACRHNGYHQPGQCPEANEVAAGVDAQCDSGGITDPPTAAGVRGEAMLHAGLALSRGDRMEPVAHGDPGSVIGVVRLGCVTIHSSEPEALLELAEALRVAAARMRELGRVGGEG